MTAFITTVVGPSYEEAVKSTVAYY